MSLQLFKDFLDALESDKIDDFLLNNKDFDINSKINPEDPYSKSYFQHYFSVYDIKFNDLTRAGGLNQINEHILSKTEKMLAMGGDFNTSFETRNGVFNMLSHFILNQQLVFLQLAIRNGADLTAPLKETTVIHTLCSKQGFNYLLKDVRKLLRDNNVDLSYVFDKFGNNPLMVALNSTTYTKYNPYIDIALERTSDLKVKNNQNENVLHFQKNFKLSINANAERLFIKEPTLKLNVNDFSNLNEKPLDLMLVNLDLHTLLSLIYRGAYESGNVGKDIFFSGITKSESEERLQPRTLLESLMLKPPVQLVSAASDIELLRKKHNLEPLIPMDKDIWKEFHLSKDKFNLEKKEYNIPKKIASYVELVKIHEENTDFNELFDEDYEINEKEESVISVATSPGVLSYSQLEFEDANPLMFEKQIENRKRLFTEFFKEVVNKSLENGNIKTDNILNFALKNYLEYKGIIDYLKNDLKLTLNEEFPFNPMLTSLGKYVFDKNINDPTNMIIKSICEKYLYLGLSFKVKNDITDKFEDVVSFSLNHANVKNGQELNEQILNEINMAGGKLSQILNTFNLKLNVETITNIVDKKSLIFLTENQGIRSYILNIEINEHEDGLNDLFTIIKKIGDDDYGDKIIDFIIDRNKEKLAEFDINPLSAAIILGKRKLAQKINKKYNKDFNLSSSISDLLISDLDVVESNPVKRQVLLNNMVQCIGDFKDDVGLLYEPNNMGLTPLMASLYASKNELLSMLLSIGVDPNKDGILESNDEEYTALDIAMKKENNFGSLLLKELHAPSKRSSVNYSGNKKITQDVHIENGDVIFSRENGFLLKRETNKNKDVNKPKKMKM